jgi:hypothetical protein
MSDDKVRCPRCNSTQIHAEMRGWSWLTGILGSRAIRITCLACGHQFKPGQGVMRGEALQRMTGPANDERISYRTPMTNQRRLASAAVSLAALVGVTAWGLNHKDESSATQPTPVPTEALAPVEAPAPVATRVAEPVAATAPAEQDAASDAVAAPSAEPPTPPMKFSDGIVAYPKGASEKQLVTAIPEFKCMDYHGRLCTITQSLEQIELVDFSGMPPCEMRHEIGVYLTDDKVSGFSCDIAPTTAENIAKAYAAKYGQVAMSSEPIGPMTVNSYTWNVDGDTVAVVHYGGYDVNGSALDHFSLITSSHVAGDASATPEAFKTSFDCSKARSDAEHLICGDSKLAAADTAFADLFAKAKSAAQDPVAFNENARLAWNDREQNCHDRACLIRWYAAQIDRLTAVAQQTDAASGSSARN